MTPKRLYALFGRIETALLSSELRVRQKAYEEVKKARQELAPLTKETDPCSPT